MCVCVCVCMCACVCVSLCTHFANGVGMHSVLLAVSELSAACCE